MIRKADAADLPEIVRWGRDFVAYSPWAAVPMDQDAFADFSLKLIEGGVIFLSEEGMLGGLVQPLFFNPEVLLGAELFWWAPKAGRELRLAFEAWCADQGAAFVQFSGLADSRAPILDRLFSRAGYERVETAYLKRL
jgi:hypothetical protein